MKSTGAIPLDDLPRPGVAIPLTRWTELLAAEQRSKELEDDKALLRAALKDCLAMSPLDPIQRGDMICRVLEATAT